VPPTPTWTASDDRRELAAAWQQLIGFTTLPREIVAPVRRLGGHRKSIDHPAQDWLDLVARTDRVAVLGVRIHNLDDLGSYALVGFDRSIAGAGFEPATFGL
jgi:hypothetical protein